MKPLTQIPLHEQKSLIPQYSNVTQSFQDAQQQALAAWETLPLPFIERMSYPTWELFSQVIASPKASANDLVSTYKNNLKLSDDQQLSARIAHCGNTTDVDFVLADLMEQGVIIQDLFTAMNEFPELVDAHLFSAISATEDKVAAYHTAFMNGGLFIYIPKNVEVNLPIEAVLLQDSRQELAFNKHILIVADTNSRVEYLEKSNTIGDKSNSATLFVEVIALNGASVKYVSMDSLGANTTSFIRRYGLTQPDANISWAVAAMNNGDTILDSYTVLDGNGSSSNVDVISISNQSQTQTINTKILNVGKNTTANIFQHGVILDQARLTFNGIGHIVKNAKGADAQQESRVMMLSDDARADTNPILYIDEFEVTAGHAASVGQVDEEQLYYLMSRGLKHEEAEYLLIRGFLGQVIQTMPSNKVRQQMVEIIDEKLKTLNHD